VRLRGRLPISSSKEKQQKFRSPQKYFQKGVDVFSDSTIFILPLGSPAKRATVLSGNKPACGSRSATADQKPQIRSPLSKVP